MDINTLRLLGGHLSNFACPQHSGGIKAENSLWMQSGKFGYISNSNFVSVSDQTELFQFTSHTFTPAGAIGRNGPAESSVRSAYSGATWAQDVTNLSVTGGIQRWRVPKTGVYRLVVRGASSTDVKPGWVQVRVSLTKGDFLRILVGQQPDNALAGAGGSFVVSESLGKLVAAGGGGGHYLSTGGSHALAQNATQLGGGQAASTSEAYGGGGAGFDGDGAVWSGWGVIQAECFGNGGRGGLGRLPHRGSPGYAGGFGGGGGGADLWYNGTMHRVAGGGGGAQGGNARGWTGNTGNGAKGGSCFAASTCYDVSMTTVTGNLLDGAVAIIYEA